ncbi:type II secretion system inner membrane protein GspF [Parvularcula sp. IMCC14364]|uniref:type II secretion system inner membrane protein GspF n=1 Tax=Parvularcula sp. IMCC14364 TaxID=3067902 RepID=UPI0027411D02|nr:type II secretion system inner membrane protein GspF [Parvularcula sp. IMCC14364]
MTAFQYQALDTTGKTRKGILSADSVRLARRELLDRGLTPLSLENVGMDVDGQKRKKPSFSKHDVVLVTRQIAILVNSATPVEEALNAVAAQMNKPGVRGTLLTIRSRVIEGWRLSDALAEHPLIFSDLYRGIIAAGETSGDLGTVMVRLADMLEKNRATLMKAMTSLIYPAALAVIATLVISGMMIFIVPKIVEQFDTMGAQLPLVTRLVIGVSGFLQNWGIWLLIVTVLAVMGFWRALSIPAMRLRVDTFLLRLPVFGRLAKGMDAARFARTLSTLFASGVPLLDCLQASRRTVMNTRLREQLADTLTSVREGASLAGGLQKAAAFPPMLGYMVAAGERAGELPLMLDKTAAQMESEFDTATTVALRLIEPVIVVGMGLIIMTVMLAILVPVLQINTLTVG